MSHEEWKNWTTKNYDYLYHYALKKLDDQEIIKDLIQETFLVALQNYEQFERRSSELTWLTAILKHKIYQVYRCRSRCKCLYDAQLGRNRLSPSRPEKGISSLHLKDPVVAKEFVQALASHVASLPISWQQVYELKFMDEVDAATICKQLNLTSSNYWVITHRLKASLKNWYLKSWQ